MAFKRFEIENIGQITVYKRAGARSLRLSIRPDGTVRVTIPTWTPYAAGVTFASSRAEWIRTHMRPTPGLLQNGQLVGKSHHLHFIRSRDAAKVATRVQSVEITVTYPEALQATDLAVQQAASNACIRALRKQAERLLPMRLQELAKQHGKDYKSVSIKQLKTRWGSCDQSRHITLNLFLMQLPWELIDYVLLHELTHTEVMQHGPAFWQAMESLEPRTKGLRKQIREHQPILTTSL